jgi:hypothetical protein
MARPKTDMRTLRLARPGGGRRKLIGLLVLVGLVLLVVNDPAGAADVVGTVADGLYEFVKALFSSR